MKNLKKQTGSTLLELVMVIGIIAVIAIAAITYFNAANDANKINDEVQNVNTLSGAIRNMFNSQGDYTGLENKIIIKSGAFPDRMRVPGSTDLIKNSWLNAGVVVKPVNNMGTNNDSFSITYAGVPERACLDLVSKTFRSYDKVSVGGVAVSSVALATANCKSGVNSIEFIAR